MKELIELFAEKVGRYPRGNVQDELRAWSANEITTLRQQLAKSEARAAELESIFIRQQGEYVKGPDGFDTWRDAAVSERTWRASMKPLNEAVDLARQAMDIFTGPNMNERKICAELVRLDEVYTREAQRLRQQADEAERAGGEK